MKFRRFMPFQKWIITIILVLIMSQLSVPVFSQVSIKDINKIDITLFIVPEIEVCKPRGYNNYNADGGTNCPPLTLDDVSMWKLMGRNWKDFTISDRRKAPYILNLGEKLFEILDVYTTRAKINANERLAAVLVFKWYEPINSEVNLTRAVSKRINILSCTWSGRLENQQYWIHHERADAFLPANDIKWILKAGNQVWEFVSKK